MLRYSPLLTALLLIPAFAGADEKPAVLPDATLHAASGENKVKSQGIEVREISSLNYEAVRNGLIAAENVSPVRFRMLKLLVNDALRDGRIDVEEYAVIRPVIYDSSAERSTGAYSLQEARQAVKDALAGEGDAAR
ncbi:hypothetical protein [Enterobacter hormaechei]|uniref:hypothetical protein n=1 Tax=Enterobacter hormaechei TaxID=158836 RepID=UPI000CEBF729|nr:hypothetical protein [Enterobacter hormaechei]ROC77441.1 hypothetical protein C4Z25_014700 [Enterobacter hormaechei subsp. steigerwaltii]